MNQSKGRYIKFDALQKIREAKGWEEPLRLIVGDDKDLNNYDITDEVFLNVLQEKGLLPNFINPDGNNNIIGIYFDDNTSILTIETINGIFTINTSGSVLEENVTTTVTVGASDAYTTLPKDLTFTEYVKLVHQKIYYPTFINPSFSLIKSVNTLQEVDIAITFDLTFNFNRGIIKGDIVGGVWSPTATQNPLAGASNAYTIDGYTQTIPTLNISKVISQGINFYAGTVDYDEGVQPLDSTGNIYGSKYPAGTSPSQTTSIEGVFPIYATTATITVATKQALVSMLSGNNIQKTLIAESGGNKQFFDLPNDWITSRPLISIQFFNVVSGNFDPTNQISTFTASSITHVIQGNTINYTRYTNNGANRGDILIKLIF